MFEAILASRVVAEEEKALDAVLEAQLQEALAASQGALSSAGAAAIGGNIMVRPT